VVQLLDERIQLILQKIFDPCCYKLNYQQTKEMSKKAKKRWLNKLQGVYKISSNNLVLYVGQSKQLNGRIDKHKHHIKNPNSKGIKQKKLYDTINTQYPNYTISIIEECSVDKLIERENYWINELKPILNTLI
jgi:predicted GIY-YIG superfamily endonuclease